MLRLPFWVRYNTIEMTVIIIIIIIIIIIYPELADLIEDCF